jgi:hypothetical protein
MEWTTARGVVMLAYKQRVFGFLVNFDDAATGVYIFCESCFGQDLSTIQKSWSWLGLGSIPLTSLETARQRAPLYLC